MELFSGSLTCGPSANECGRLLSMLVGWVSHPRLVRGPCHHRYGAGAVNFLRVELSRASAPVDTPIPFAPCVIVSAAVAIQFVVVLNLSSGNLPSCHGRILKWHLPHQKSLPKQLLW